MRDYMIYLLSTPLTITTQYFTSLIIYHHSDRILHLFNWVVVQGPMKAASLHEISNDALF